MHRVGKGVWLAIFALALLVMSFAPPAQAAGHRLAANISEPFEVNGQLFPAGTLTLRAVQAYSPIATLSEAWVDGQCLGMLITQQRSAAGPGPAEIHFGRSPRGHLVFLGLSTTTRPELNVPARLKQAQAPAPASPAPILLARNEARCID